MRFFRDLPSAGECARPFSCILATSDRYPDPLKMPGRRRGWTRISSQRATRDGQRENRGAEREVQFATQTSAPVGMHFSGYSPCTIQGAALSQWSGPATAAAWATAVAGGSEEHTSEI